MAGAKTLDKETTITLPAGTPITRSLALFQQKSAAEIELPKLRDEIKRQWEEMTTSMAETLTRYVTFGENLKKAKDLCKMSGEKWGQWVDANLPTIGVRQADHYIQVHENKDQLTKEFRNKAIPFSFGAALKMLRSGDSPTKKKKPATKVVRGASAVAEKFLDASDSVIKKAAADAKLPANLDETGLKDFLLRAVERICGYKIKDLEGQPAKKKK